MTRYVLAIIATAFFSVSAFGAVAIVELSAELDGVSLPAPDPAQQEEHSDAVEAEILPAGPSESGNLGLIEVPLNGVRVIRLGDLRGGKFESAAFALNREHTVVGYGAGPEGRRAVVWRRIDDERWRIERLPTEGHSEARGISDNDVIAGFDVERPTVWRWAEGWTRVVLPGGRGEARSVSRDGSVVVGFVEDENGLRAARWLWSAEDGWTLHPLPGEQARATSVNADGSVIGGAVLVNGQPTPVIWAATEEGFGEPTRLYDGAGEALSVSSDGHTVAGYLQTDSMNAVAWTRDVAEGWRPTVLLSNGQALATNRILTVGFGPNRDATMGFRGPLEEPHFIRVFDRPVPRTVFSAVNDVGTIAGYAQFWRSDRNEEFSRAPEDRISRAQLDYDYQEAFIFGEYLNTSSSPTLRVGSYNSIASLGTSNLFPGGFVGGGRGGLPDVGGGGFGGGGSGGFRGSSNGDDPPIIVPPPGGPGDGPDVVPEPDAFVLLAMGALAMAFYLRLKRGEAVVHGAASA